jgi:DNA-binding NtrC family response regulator
MFALKHRVTSQGWAGFEPSQCVYLRTVSAYEGLVSGEKNHLPIVLVIDDDAIVNEIVVEMLNCLGYVAVSASNAAETHEIVNTTPSVRVLICDVYLADTTGPTLIREILKTRRDLKVIFMSGALTESPFRRTDPFLEKPFDLNTLRTTVERVLTKSLAALDSDRSGSTGDRLFREDFFT